MHHIDQRGGKRVYFKLLLSEAENEELEGEAKKAGLDKTGYIKKKLGLKASQNIFTVEYAVDLAKTEWPKSTPFTLSELYGKRWENIQNGVAGVLGRNFYKYVTTVESGIVFLGKKEITIGNQKRKQAQYVVKK